MGVISNLKGIIKSMQIKTKEQSIAKDAVLVGSVGSQFLTQYETFKVSLLAWIEVNLENKGNSAMILRPKPGTDASKFMRYTLEDPSITDFYHVEQRTGGEFLYKLKDGIGALSLDELQNESANPNVNTVEDEDDNIIYI